MVKRTLLAAAAVAMLAVPMAGCFRSDPLAYEKPRRYQQAEGLYLRGKWEQAKVLFLDLSVSNAYNEKPFRLEALYYAGRCDQNLGNWGDAVRAYNNVLNSVPYRSLEVRALVSRAEVNREIQDFKSAIRDYESARFLMKDTAVKGLDPQAVDPQMTLFWLAMSHRNEGNRLSGREERKYHFDTADRLFDEYLNRWPNGRYATEAQNAHSKLGGGRPALVNFTVRVGGKYTSGTLAEEMAARLVAKGFKDVRIETDDMAGQKFFVVCVGTFDGPKPAEELHRAIVKAGFSPTKVWP